LLRGKKERVRVSNRDLSEVAKERNGYLRWDQAPFGLEAFPKFSFLHLGSLIKLIK